MSSPTSSGSDTEKGGTVCGTQKISFAPEAGSAASDAGSAGAGPHRRHAGVITHTDPVPNRFTPAHVSCNVTEDFDGTTKKNVNVTNTGDIDAYLRVKLVTYRVNDDGQHIGGTAAIPAFTPGDDWVKYGDYYYYTYPVAPGQQPETPLIDSLTLIGSYNDADGGKQALEIMAEAIQSAPEEAAGQAWGVTITPGRVAQYQ